MRKFLKIVLFILLLPVIYLVVINLLPDEELSAGAKEWLKPEPITVPKEQNSYYLMWGLDAPADVDMQEYGEAVVDGMVQAGDKLHRYDPDASESYLPEAYDHDARIRAVGLGDRCKVTERFCLDEYRRSADKVLTQGDNILLLERYLAISNLMHYRRVEPVGINSIPYFSPLTNVQRLRHIVITSMFFSGKHGEALEDLAVDLRFSRMLLSEADTLILKFIAMRMVANDLHLYGQLMESDEAAIVAKEVSEISTLSESEGGFGEVFRGELRFQKSMMQYTSDNEFNEDIGGGGMNPFGVLPRRDRHFLNISYRYMFALLDAYGNPPTRFKLLHRELVKKQPGVWETVKNPLNSILLSIAMPMYPSYMLRSHDLNGLIRLLKLKGKIVEDGVTAEDVDEYIATSPYASAHSQESVAVHWDPQRQVLFFSSMAESNNANTTQLYLSLKGQRSDHSQQ
ncbi:MAG: hypothetical protein ABFS08_09130 [Pseudomonadota bacterium]